MSLTRRRFLAAGSAAAGCLAGRSLLREAPAADAPADAPPIVDTHEHLWDLTRLRLSWLTADKELNRSFLTRDYLAATAGLGVVQAVYMEVDSDRDQKAAEADYVLDLCRRGDTPMRAAVIGGYPADPGFPQYMARHRGSPWIKGLRQIFRPDRDGRSPYRDAAFRAGIRLLGEWGMSFDLCLPPDRLAEAVELADACPGTRMILDHCGNADPHWFRSPAAGEPVDPAAQRWRHGVAELARRSQVVCKISGIVSRMPQGQWTAADLSPVVDHCLDCFGPDRVMFAGDWPVCTRGATYRQWVEALRAIVRTRPPQDQRKLFHDNARRFYNLPAAQRPTP